MIPTNLLSDFLAAQGYTGQIQDSFSRFLSDRGYVGALPEAEYRFLDDLGYPYSLNEKEYKWMLDGMPALPMLVVTGGVITPFNSGGTDYIEIAFAASGSFTLSQPVPNARWALGAGGGAGGRVPNIINIGSPGGAGGLLRSAASVTLAAGAYSVAIGAGAPATYVTGASSNGSDSVLTTPSGTQTAVGGGKGASTGAGNTDGGSGGSGGAGRATSGTEGSMTVPGTGVAGQGFAGGAGYSSPTDANRATGGSGGAGSAGGNATLGVVGTAGAGVLLDWIATPRTVCAGQPGILVTQTAATPDQTWGNGSQAAINAQVGKGGDGFFFLVVRATDVNVVMA